MHAPSGEFNLTRLERVIYGPGTYAQGTDATGKFPVRGRELLREMDRLGMILDVTHLTDEEFWEALDLYHGPIWASHNNCRALVPHQRQFNAEQLKELIRRDAVIGAAFDAWMGQVATMPAAPDEDPEAASPATTSPAVPTDPEAADTPTTAPADGSRQFTGRAGAGPARQGHELPCDRRRS